MTKVNYAVVFALCSILFLSCEQKKTTEETLKKEEVVKTPEEEINLIRLREAQEEFSTVNYEKAIESWGEPNEETKIKIKKDSIPFNLEELVKKHYPNKEYINSTIEIIEAAWQMEGQSWIQVWYKLQNDEWVPIDILVTV